MQLTMLVAALGMSCAAGIDLPPCPYGILNGFCLPSELRDGGVACVNDTSPSARITRPSDVQCVPKKNGGALYKCPSWAPHMCQPVYDGKNIVELAAATPTLSTLVTALKAGKLTDALSGTGPFTVFAPTNEAFAKLPKSTLDDLLDPKNIINSKWLDQVLEYHVISGAAVYKTDLKAEQKVKTLEGHDVDVIKSTSGGVSVDQAKVLMADVNASNGVVHIIDSILIPSRTNPPTAPTPAPSQYAQWNSVLQRHVKKGAQFGVPIHVVNYGGIASDPDFAKFIEFLAIVDTTSMSKNESFALGINMYNAFAIKTMIDFACKYEDNEQRTGDCLGPAYGLPDIVIGGVKGLAKKMHNFSGTLYSCNDIEGMMRPVPLAPLFSPPIDTTEDLRAHACLVCGGTSCPNVALTAFDATNIESQMDAATTDWMANPWKGMRINTTSNTVHVSNIMNWFGDEFDAQGGWTKAYHRFLPADAQAYFAKEPKFNVEFMTYIWDANGPVPCSCTPSPIAPSTVEAGCHPEGWHPDPEADGGNQRLRTEGSERVV